MLRRTPTGTDPGPELGDWECVAAGWWSKPAEPRPAARRVGPAAWKRATPTAAAAARPRRRLPAVRVTDVHQTDNDIRFHVSRTGVPVVVRTSYFPNWEAHGAHGPWRLSPNLMVVVPTRHDVSLHFARSGAEKVGGGGQRGRAWRASWRSASPTCSGAVGPVDGGETPPITAF